LLQYRLLCLPEYQQAGEELCRLGALIFSYGVIFPVARRKPLDVLVTRLRTALKCHQDISFLVAGKDSATTSRSTQARPATTLKDLPMALLNHWQSTTDFLLWIAVLGALASKGTEHEVFFVDLLQTLSTAARVADFSQLRSTMRKYLWLGRACDTAAFELWRK